jgi:4-hydroxythreonine-4-phosphate dehydrogenase
MDGSNNPSIPSSNSPVTLWQQQQTASHQTAPLAITVGDPAGIGPEVVLKALADPNIADNCQVTVVGTRSLLERTYQQLRQLGQPAADPASLSMLDIPLDFPLVCGQGNAASGEASFAYLEAAIAGALTGEFQGIVTGPIAKSCWQAAGHPFPGQTEFLAQQAGVDRYGMLFVARSPHSDWRLRTLLATTHIPLGQVPTVLNPELLAAKLDLLVESLATDFAIAAPRIAIAGLNPHSGEAGQLGREEQDWLIPWLRREQEARPQLQLLGPVPPDTLWVSAGQSWYDGAEIANAIDAYLALYHDQGLIPVKLLAFDRAVNTTIGLPFVRTSPDHGTAFDIAGTGVARPDSMKAAIELAVELSQRRCR